MDRIIVKSNLIHGIGYCAGILEVEFRDGELYEYRDVPAEVFHELTVAKSVGVYFIQNIKTQYPYSKIL